MKDNYLIVNKNILPSFYEKVIIAQNLLKDGTAKDISDAIKIVGISRSTFYKYKDSIFTPSQDSICSKAVFTFELSHEPGMLTKVLSIFVGIHANILTITQNMPINKIAHVVISIDITNVEISMEEIVRKLLLEPRVNNAKLIAIE